MKKNQKVKRGKERTKIKYGQIAAQVCISPTGYLCLQTKFENSHKPQSSENILCIIKS
jgi:hypothetical protein